MNIGGGEGQVLSCILKLPGCKHVDEVLFDFPDVIECSKKFLAKEEIPDNPITFTIVMALHFLSWLNVTKNTCRLDFTSVGL